MSYTIDDSVIDAEFRELVKLKEREVGPEPPYWYKPERSCPPMAEIIGLADSEKGDHSLRVIQAAVMESRIGLETSAVFDRDVDWVKIGEIDQWVSTILRNEHDALIAFMESQVLQPKARRRSLVEYEEAATKEDYVLECFDDWKMSAIQSGDGTLLSSLAYDATIHSMWAIYTAPDPGNYRTGMRYRRVDPKTVFPIFEGDRGLGQVFRVYDAECKDMLGWYGDGSGSVSRAIRDLSKTGSGLVDMHASHECVEWYGRTWAMIIWGGKVIRKWKHRMHRPPWVVIPFCWRRMNSSVGLGGEMGGDMWGSALAPNDQGILSIASGKQRDYARIYEPFLAPRLPLHDAMEKIASRLMTAVRVARDPPLVYNKPLTAGNKSAPEVQNWEHGLTVVPERQTAGPAFEPLPTLPVKEAMDPLIQIMTTAMQAGIPAPLLQGATLAAQTSGSAIDVLMQTGWDKWVPVAQGFNAGFTEVAHKWLLNFKEWGSTLGPDADGYIDVPRRMMDPYGMNAYYEMSPEILERTDCYMDVTLARFNLQGMLQAATTIATIRNQIGVMSKREAIELLAYTNNVERSMQMHREEELEETPGVLEAMTIEHLYEQLYVAYLQKDMESVRRIAIRGKRVAARQRLADLQLAAMGGGGDFGGGGIPPTQGVSADGTAVPIGEDQGQGAGAATPQLPPGDIGNAVGTEGGRPPL